MATEELTRYCICRSPDIDRFMIMCDQCEEWYHGDCINITEKESRKIKYFYCKPCRRKDPLLKIHYRKKKHVTDDKKIKKKKKVKHEGERKELKPPREERQRNVEQKPGKTEQAVVSKSKPLSTEKPTDLKQADALPSPSDHPVSHGADIQMQYGHSQVRTATKSDPDGCGMCDNCLRTKDCMECKVCRGKLKYKLDSRSGEICWQRKCLSQKGPSLEEQSARLNTHQAAAKECQKAAVKHDHDLTQLDHVVTPDFAAAPLVMQKEFKPKHKQHKDRARHFQCYGPGCTRVARVKSKYCSDECGRRLAAKRLMHIMPSRVSDWNNTPTVANETGREELERIRNSMVQARSELQALEEKFRRLESIISHSKTFPIDESMTEDENADESDQTVFCVVCGHPVALRTAVKHMDRCYIKIESQISFGSVYPTRIEGSERLFCDVYNRQQQTYCKRLQVICPEHSKEPKVAANEVCGCPLRNDIYDGEEPSGASEFCRRAKRKCSRHFKWESMYRASVDLQRIRQWLKIDEIFEEERRIRNAMVSRAGVIPLLLHQTTAHDRTCLDMRTKPSNVKRPAYRLVI